MLTQLKREPDVTMKRSQSILSFRAKSRNLWLLLLGAADAQKTRDVSTPLDMTKHGHDASHPSFPRDRTDRVSLFIGRPRRCIGLHRDDDVVRNRADRHPPNCTCAEHSCGVNRHVSILACRALLVETVLALCAAFHSGSVCRWLLAAFGFDSENSNRRCAALFGGPPYGSPN